MIPSVVVEIFYQVEKFNMLSRPSLSSHSVTSRDLQGPVWPNSAALKAISFKRLPSNGGSNGGCRMIHLLIQTTIIQ